MKKLLSIFPVLVVMVLVFASTITQAQDKSYSFKLNKSLNIYNNYAPVSHFNFTEDDSIDAVDSLYSIVLTLNQTYPIKYNIRHKLDSVSGTPTTTVYLQGRVFTSDSWSAISNVYWAGTSSDTTITFTENSTAKFYRQLRIYHDADGSVTQKYNLDELEVKLWPSP